MIDYDRRRFLGTAAMTIAATQLGALGSASAQAVQAIPTGPFGPVKQIYAGFLNVGYVESGPAKGPAVVLLHGWPYDIHTYVDVAPRLASAGYQRPERTEAESRERDCQRETERGGQGRTQQESRAGPYESAALTV